MFNFGIIFLFLAIIPLPFLDRSSAEFIVDVVSLFLIVFFLIAVSLDVRRQSSLGSKRRPEDKG